MRKLLLCSTAVLALWGCTDGTEPSVPTTISVTPATFDAVGATQVVRASVLDQRGRAVRNPAISWASSSPAVTVTPLSADSALLRSAAAGTATVTASVGTASGTGQATVDPVPVQIQAFSGDNQVGTQGQALGTPLRVRILDRLGIGVVGKTVSFAIVSGGGTLSAASAVTDSDGGANVNWTLGSALGAQAVTASFGTLTATFNATAAVPSQGVVARFSGGNEAVMVGSAVSARPSVRVVGGGNQPVPGVQVTFTAGTGSAATGTTVTTNANGVATVGAWTVNAPGPVTLTAQVAGSYLNNPVTFTAYGCQGGGGTGFAVTVCYTSSMTPSQRAVFADAAARWSSVITGDLPNTAESFAAGACGASSPVLNLTIDDVVIFASVVPIDGSGRVLGRATPCYIRDAAPQLPVLGYMEFDVADVVNLEAANSFASVITHEMGHVLGIGTLWGYLGLLKDPSSEGSVLDTWFSGTNALAGFDATGGTAYTGAKVPVENTGGGGTVNSHWREAVLRSELMTGYLNSGTNPLSRITVGSLADLGYSVNVAAADPFSLAAAISANRAGSATPVVHMVDDVPDFPIQRLGPGGRRTVIPQR